MTRPASEAELRRRGTVSQAERRASTETFNEWLAQRDSRRCSVRLRSDRQ
jgi:hypothetical protein